MVNSSEETFWQHKIKCDNVYVECPYFLFNEKQQFTGNSPAIQVRRQCFHCQGQCLVGESRFCKPCGEAPPRKEEEKEKKKKQQFTNCLRNNTLNISQFKQLVSGSLVSNTRFLRYGIQSCLWLNAKENAFQMVVAEYLQLSQIDLIKIE